MNHQVSNYTIMTPEDYQWHIKLVQSRHHSLNLSLEQAELVYKYEQDKDLYSENLFFSDWEEWDYELFSFKKILTNDQFALYEEGLNVSIDNYRNSLIEHDKGSLNEIEYNKEALKYYEEEFLPHFFKDPVLSTFSWLHEEKAKIDFLKAEYKRYLNGSKKEILINHFRHYRTYKPNELEASLLRHKLSCLWPDYPAFKYRIDEPTKTVAGYLRQKLTWFQDKYDGFIKNKLEGLIAFNEANSKKYHGEPKGWHIMAIGQLTEEEEKEYRVMSLLLLDREKYGY